LLQHILTACVVRVVSGSELICSVLYKNRMTGTRNGWCNCPNVTFAKLKRWFIKCNSVGCCGSTLYDLEGHDSYREASNTKLY
jgi:hypothetical protein